VRCDQDNEGNRPKNNPREGRISDADAEELWKLMAQTQTQEGRFLAAMCPDLRSITQAPAADYHRLRNALLTKVSVLEQRAAAERAAKARQPQNGDAR
jgi:hypothetical protein